MSEKPLLTERDGAIFIVKLNRPAKLNAMNLEMLGLLGEAILEFRDDPALRVMLIRSSGRYFCSGGDVLGKLMDTSSGHVIREGHRLGNGMQRMWDEIEHIEKPVIVAHHAACVGGGLELSLSCDFRLAARSASYSFPEAVFGSLPASNGISRMTRLVGEQWTSYMVTANKPISAERAYRIGLLHEIYDDDVFDEEVMAFCRHVASQLPEMTGVAKIAIKLCRDISPGQGRSVERLSNSTLFLGQEFAEQGNVVREHLARQSAERAKKAQAAQQQQ